MPRVYSPRPLPPPPPTAPPPRQGNTTTVLVVFAVAIVVIVGVGAGTVLVARGMHRGEDVGELPALAGVQAQLRPLDACEIRYSPQSRYNQSKYVFVAPCTGESFPPTVSFAVDDTWSQRRIAFTAQRSSRTKRWEVRVDKGAVSLPDLVTALESIAPTIARDYPARLTTTLAGMKKAKDDLEAQEAERVRARKRAEESYR